MSVVDGAGQLAAVERTVSRGVRDGDAMRIVTLRQTYATTVEDVWEACTTAERVGRWFLPLSGDLRLGGQYQLEGNAGGTILACEAPNRVAVTWEFGGNTSWVELRLGSVVADGTTGAWLELEHVAPMSAFWTMYGPGAVGVGWDGGFLGLAGYLARGEGMDQAAAAAWMASPEGLAFYRASSAAWAEAAIASGEDAAWAREAEQQTTAFYTGEPVAE